MANKVERPSTTSTALQRVGLAAGINLSDGHARINEDSSVRSIFEEAGLHFRSAAVRPLPELETKFVQAFETTYSIQFPRRPVLCYSASSLAGIVGTLLGPRARVVWPVPSFDNMRDVVRNAGVEISVVPESIVAEFVNTAFRSANFEGLWLTLPNNPSGLVLSADDYVRIATNSARAGIILIVDHCFRAFSQTMTEFDQYRILEQSGCRYIVLEDTGKTLSTLDLKVGLLIASADLHDKLRLLNEDLTLCVSPFVLEILTAVLDAWSKSGGISQLRQTIDSNRQILRAVYNDRVLVPEMHSTEVPFEWLDTGAPEAGERLLRLCASYGLQLLPGVTFFGGPSAAGSRYLRIALSRDLEVVRAGSEALEKAVRTFIN